jgi:hypothetical protein
MAKNKRRDDPIADYIEWTEHRYDPGHYLGGNLPPHLRKASLGPNARRRAGLFIVVTALMTVFGALSTVAFEESDSPWERVPVAGLVVLTVSAAVRMYRSGLPASNRNKPR